MTEYHRIPTEQELDLLLEQPPHFDPEAVKQRTLARLEEFPAVPVRRPPALRSLLIAALVCLLCISAVTAADYAAAAASRGYWAFRNPRWKSPRTLSRNRCPNRLRPPRRNLCRSRNPCRNLSRNRQNPFRPWHLLPRPPPKLRRCA